MELALSLSVAIVAIIFAVPALFLGVYNFFANRDLLRQLDLDRRENVSPQATKNTVRNLTSFGANEVPSIHDNLGEDTYGTDFDDVI